MQKSSEIDMIHGHLLKNIFLFSIPLMATNLLQMLFNAADTIVVGKFAGQEALAAVGATGSLIFLLTSIFNGLSMGTNVVIANAIGGGNHDKISKSVHTSIIIGLVGGGFLTIFGFFASKFFLELMSTPTNIIDQSTSYMRIYFLGSIFMILYNFGAAILRSKGDTKRPLYFLLVSGLLNVGLNLLFVIVFKMAVVGVALATVISQAVACFLVLISLFNTNDATKLVLSELKLEKHIASEIMRIGIPAGIQGMAFSISNVVVQSSINSFGSSIIVAGNSAAANIENFVYVGMMAFSQATITFTSQNIGAGKYDNIKKIMSLTMILDCASALIVGSIAYLGGTILLSLYTNDPQVVSVGMFRLFYIALFLFINGALDVFINSLRGMGFSGVPTIIMLVGVCGVRLAWLLLYFPSHPSLDVIYFCYPLSWTVTTIIEGILWIKCYRETMKAAPTII